jgi:hypothetical protein
VDRGKRSAIDVFERRLLLHALICGGRLTAAVDLLHNLVTKIYFNIRYVRAWRRNNQMRFSRSSSKDDEYETL